MNVPASLLSAVGAEAAVACCAPLDELELESVAVAEDELFFESWPVDCPVVLDSDSLKKDLDHDTACVDVFGRKGSQVRSSILDK
ncbi:MAG: hypothetical protein KIT69_21485 [Propionibacteriaceae bacterium]|nr:hypothetical protein [Propionibacteriaceae bacterium]